MEVLIEWPNGKTTISESGKEWIGAAREAGIVIPTGCLGGSCGACEIEVNGKVIRACIENIPTNKAGKLNVEFASDPFW